MVVDKYAGRCLDVGSTPTGSIFFIHGRLLKRLKRPCWKRGRRVKACVGSNPTSSFCISAGWSSSVARRAHNPKVVGSNPAPAIMVLWCRGYHACLSRRRSPVQIRLSPLLKRLHQFMMWSFFYIICK